VRSPEEAIAAARGMVGVPWIHQGRNPKLGIDCVGLMLLAYGMTYDYRTYSTHPHNGLLEAQLQLAFGVAPRLEYPNFRVVDLRLGDVLAMTYSKGRVVRHVGLVGDYVHGGPSIIHTDSEIGAVVECRIDDAIFQRIHKVFTP
jgi:cell wall-associated NlpC family hydrolase